VSVPFGACGEGGGDGRGGNGLSTVPGGKLLKAKHTHMRALKSVEVIEERVVREEREVIVVSV
jgi:hypothetical protein